MQLVIVNSLANVVVNAFDRVWHKGLIFKLKQLGINGDVLKWVSNYLDNRQQRVVIKSCKSKKVREKSRECHNHKPQPFPDPKRKMKPTNLNKHKPNKRFRSTNAGVPQ